MSSFTTRAGRWPTVKIDGSARRRRSPAAPVMPTVPPAPPPPHLLRGLRRRGSLADRDSIGRNRRRPGNGEQPDRGGSGGGQGEHSQCHCTLHRMLVEPGDDRSKAVRRPAFDGPVLHGGSKCGASALIGLQTFRERSSANSTGFDRNLNQFQVMARRRARSDRRAVRPCRRSRAHPRRQARRTRRFVTAVTVLAAATCERCCDDEAVAMKPGPVRRTKPCRTTIH
jgi:hypothetical protein